MTEQEQIEQILLRHRGKRNAITSGQIAAALGRPNEEDTHVLTRGQITELLERSNLPIGSSSAGYFIIETDNELNDYTKTLDGRISGIDQRKKKVTKNFKENHQ
jgi:hypothetical protein